jgi:hypothetical protein
VSGISGRISERARLAGRNVVSAVARHCTRLWVSAFFDSAAFEKIPFLDRRRLEIKLLEFRRYCNGHRAHAGLEGRPPDSIPAEGGARASIRSYRWQPHCRGLYHTPMAA